MAQNAENVIVKFSFIILLGGNPPLAGTVYALNRNINYHQHFLFVKLQIADSR